MDPEGPEKEESAESESTSEAKENNDLTIEITPEQAAAIYEETQSGNSATLVLSHTQINESHHYYPSTPIDEIQQLGELDPPLCNELVGMMKKDQALYAEGCRHRWEMERKGLFRGPLLAVFLGLCGIFAIWRGEAVVAGVIFGTTIIGILVILVLRRVYESTETDDEE